MFFLVGLILALLAWLFGYRAFRRTGLPAREILYADVDTSFPSSRPLTSTRFRLTGKPDYLVRVKDGVVPVELKSGRAPASGQPYDGHLFQLAAYCLLVEDLYRVSVPYGLIQYDDRRISVPFTAALRADLFEILEEIRMAKGQRQHHISHNHPGKCRACGFRPVCGESLV